MFKNISRLCCSSISFYKNSFDHIGFLNQKILNPFRISSVSAVKQIHTTNVFKDLMEFFDDKKNWGESEVKVGRAWQLDELRIKSNLDLHKLWYILLKEKNMLLTMEHECNEKIRLFPSSERLDKVKISMRNLEKVVRERNKAFHELETGENGERPGELTTNSLGYNFYYKKSEHVVPQFVNTRWLKTRHFDANAKVPKNFLLLYREKLYNEKRKAKNRRRNEVKMLLRRNPNLDINMLKERFSDVDIPKLLRDDKTRGHYVPQIEVKKK